MLSKRITAFSVLLMTYCDAIEEFIIIIILGGRAQKRNNKNSVILFKIRGYTGAIISFNGPPTIFKVEKQF